MSYAAGETLAAQRCATPRLLHGLHIHRLDPRHMFTNLHMLAVRGATRAIFSGAKLA